MTCGRPIGNTLAMHCSEVSFSILRIFCWSPPSTLPEWQSLFRSALVWLSLSAFLCRIGKIRPGTQPCCLRVWRVWLPQSYSTQWRIGGFLPPDRKRQQRESFFPFYAASSCHSFLSSCKGRCPSHCLTS